MDKKYKILIVFILVGLIGYVLYNKYIKKEEINNDIKVIDVKDNENKEKEEPKVSNDTFEYYHYEEVITPEEDNEEENFLVFKSIYLFGDGEFYYNYAEYGDACGVWSKGKYEINDNKLTLKETMHGDCDECFYTFNLKEHVFTIDNGSLISSDDEKLTVSTSNSIPSVEGYTNCDKNLN